MAHIEKNKRKGGITYTVRWRSKDKSGNWTKESETFSTMIQAKIKKTTVENNLMRGNHIPDRESMTVADAAYDWLDDLEDKWRSGLRTRSTWKQARSHVNHIIKYDVSYHLLSRLTPPECQAFLDDLEVRVSPAMTQKIMVSFRSILRRASARGRLHGNPAETVIYRPGRGVRKKTMKIPPKKDIKKIINKAMKENDGFLSASVALLGFTCGLRASEIRGLCKDAVDLNKESPKIHIKRRADEQGEMDVPKSEAGHRVISIGPTTADILKKRIQAVRETDQGLLFPADTKDIPVRYSVLYRKKWLPLLKKAGLSDKEEFGLHAMRHAAVSHWIEQGMSIKKIQTQIGHASIKITMDTYGHLWRDDKSETKAAALNEEALLK